jgi:putative ABC transport system ATP-binding protein
MQAIIRFEQVSVFAQGKNILSNISFTINAGEKVALSGKSGAGKSTVLKALMGLVPLQHGQVYCRDTLLTSASVQTIRNYVAYIGQEPVLGAETVVDALLLPFQFKAHKDSKPSQAQILKALQRVQLPKAILTQDSTSISGGEKQRVAIARAMLLEKSLYLLDEVTSALDAESKQAIFDVFSDPALTVLSVAHDPDWLKCCDVILELDAGQLTHEQRCKPLI